MKQLINYCPVHGYKEEIAAYHGGMTGYLKDSNLDGVELYVYDTKPYEEDYSKWATGVHLKYWPYWLDFWRNNKEELARNHKNKQEMTAYFNGAVNHDQWLEVIQKNITTSLAVKPEYLVWHVSHCGLEEAFTRKFTYNDEQIIDATVEVFNSISTCVPDDVKVLFENLWWPGLTLTNPQVVDSFFSKLNKSNVGIMLDTGHLMSTNLELQSEKEALKYIKKVVKNLGSYKDLVQGMHFSCSLSGEYQKNSIGAMPAGITMGEILQHVGKIDQHRIFTDAPLKEFIEYIAPTYLVHELFYNTMSVMQEYVKSEQKLMKK